jgi:NAD-dependent dihydropyrimidine dehydrogenase PreA subunit
MKASPWEKEDAITRHPDPQLPVPKAFVHEGGKLTGMTFEKVQGGLRRQGPPQLVPTGEPDVHFECDDVLVAVGQENAFPWIERDIGIEFDKWGLPVLDEDLPVHQSEGVLRRRRGLRPQEHHHGRGARPRGGGVDRPLLQRRGRGDERDRAAGQPDVQKMGIHEWSYDNDVANDLRFKVPHGQAEKALASIKVEVELGFDAATAFKEAQRCLNCDVQTVFNAKQPASSAMPASTSARWTASPSPSNGDEADLRTAPERRRDEHSTQDLYVSAGAQDRPVMVKDEDVCLHCGLCAERCPTGAWDMQKFLLNTTQAGGGCRHANTRRHLEVA